MCLICWDWIYTYGWNMPTFHRDHQGSTMTWKWSGVRFSSFQGIKHGKWKFSCEFQMFFFHRPLILKPSPRSGDFRAPTAFRGAEKWMVDVVHHDMLHDFYRSQKRCRNLYGTKIRSKWLECHIWVLEMAGATQSWDTSLSTSGNIPESSPAVCKALKNTGGVAVGFCL